MYSWLICTVDSRAYLKEYDMVGVSDGCSLHDPNTPSSVLHVVLAAVKPPTPTTPPPSSSLARTSVFGYKLNCGYYLTMNITIVLFFCSNMYCHAIVLKH
jgi:hypothetical protein